MRLIDGDALVKTLKGLRALANILSGSREKPLIPFDDMVRMIEKSPTIEPVRKGKWIVYVVSMLDGEDCKCSECGQISCAPYWNFCPNCGAKMEEGEE